MSKMRGSRAYGRRTWLVNPRFQLGITAYFLFLAFLLIGVFLFSDYLIFEQFFQLGQELGFDEKSRYFEAAAQQAALLNGLHLITSLVVLTLMAVGGIWISHHIAGPLYRLRKHLEGIADGAPVAEVRVRKRDFFADLFTAYNRSVRKQDRSE